MKFCKLCSKFWEMKGIRWGYVEADNPTNFFDMILHDGAKNCPECERIEMSKREECEFCTKKRETRETSEGFRICETCAKEEWYDWDEME